MPTNHSLEHLEKLHHEAMQFFGAELMLLKEVIPRIQDDRLAKAATLLLSSGHTGTAILQLAGQVESFTSEIVMLSRAFMEKLTNFCYVSICDEKEYRAFVLHPVYKHYHNAVVPAMSDDPYLCKENYEAGKKKQETLKQRQIVQEALSIFSETKSNLNWTKKTMEQRIKVIEEWGKLLDVFFVLSKYQYYSDASEALHGSLYGCTFNLGVFEPGFDPNNTELLEKRLLKDNACVLLHMGMLVHECFTLVSYSSDIKEIWDYSYNNRGQALNLLFHILGRKTSSTKERLQHLKFDSQ